MDIGINLSILQWNIQGYSNNKFALEYLVHKRKPDVLLLQETLIVQKNLNFLNLPNYNAYHHNKTSPYAKSGIAILVKNTVNTSNHRTSTSNLLHQTITVHGVKDLHITNKYKETDVNLTTQLLDDIPEINTGHHLIGGDLNAQNTLWGSKYCSRSGALWEQFADRRNLTIMNGGSPTLLNTRNTLITNTGPKYLKKVEKRFQERKANWDLFKGKNDILHHQFEQTRNVNKEAAQIKKIIRKSSNESMPLNQPLKQNEAPIWFNSEISKLVILKNKAWQKFKAKKTPVSSLNYKKISAQVRRACKQAKKETWTCFVNSLNPTLDTKTIWTKVKKIKSSKTLDFPPIFENNDIHSHPEVIAEKFANLWSSIASNDNFSPQLIHEKTQINFSNVCDNNTTNGK
ncbi:uncharacterized protein LOC128869678 isoform X1 [Anastrepha ludens]|uniref:uncharacterized protein LOC128869678 isoform X1 n=1 Tax=Anastrepha ludens TaxID=28586 RepID=UPI0023B20673|nr:uncharacterized protein LOC128869678 isoform X1 [Anastrepha ludens]